MTAPTWQELRDAGRALIDQPDRCLAIYPTTHGNIVVCVMGDNGVLHRVSVELSEIDRMADAIVDSEARAIAAREVLHEQESSMAAHQLIQRAKGPA
jgi:hypothetical protein